jgi:hypothetical protein
LFSLASFGVIAPLSSERNAVNKSSGREDETFSIAVRIDAKKKSAFGKMLGNAVRQPSACNRSVMISQYFMEVLPFSSPDEFPTPT